MKVLGFNGSPRKQWNTATLLNKALEGAASKGATTEIVHLYDLNFKGCISCFACKTINGTSYGKCALQDDLEPYLRKIEEADAIVLGSPIYFGCVTGEMRSFLERLMFQYLVYSKPVKSLAPKQMNIGFIYTMNVTEKMAKEMAYEQKISQHEVSLKMLFGGKVEHLYSYDTYQFKDYSKVVADLFDAAQKAQHRERQFPIDCKKAFEMGAGLVTAR
ncbi:flavodoxin family protein [Desulforamulus ferrireducens]|uniref:Flavodoxin n=1 Tax=Desulforamulus ferrireducens TaxID=1833852 RepID=A0A1S6IXX2_9FIRM|nr:flavodoxin family protein [Desulforamulus ferrireducens]AQS59606.1 flavodoxin [Desulforamulus ferrireducens]